MLRPKDSRLFSPIMIEFVDTHNNKSVSTVILLLGENTEWRLADSTIVFRLMVMYQKGFYKVSREANFTDFTRISGVVFPFARKKKMLIIEEKRPVQSANQNNFSNPLKR